jgi:hypothetical protein
MMEDGGLKAAPLFFNRQSSIINYPYQVRNV